jgi:hypothetical protein
VFKSPKGQYNGNFITLNDACRQKVGWFFVAKKVNMQSKLQDIQDFAKMLDQQLYREFGSERVCTLINGGNLFLGEHYGKSDKIFMTFNPGNPKEGPKKFHVEVSPVDRYWDNPEAHKYPNWKNCNFFFASQPTLKCWIHDATSTFLIPWRTDDILALNKDRALKQRVCEYSAQIIHKMLEHHQARMLIVSGVATLRYLASKEFLNFDLNSSVVDRFYLGSNYSNYQCKRVQPNRNYERLVIFQVPHFSRANSKPLLQQCSLWLLNEFSKLKGT